MPEPIPVNRSVQSKNLTSEPTPVQKYEGPWRKENSNALSGFNELSNYKEPKSFGTIAMNEAYGEHNWKVDKTAYESESGPDAFGRLPSEKADLLVSPDGDVHRAQQEQEK